MKHSILVTDRAPEEALIFLKTQPDVEVTVATDFRNLDLSQVHGLMVRSKTKVDSKLLGQMPNLKAIVTATSGFDHIDLKATAERGLKVGHTPDANAASAAELTWMLVLECARGLSKAQQSLKSGKWNRDLAMGTQLAGKTYGIVGLGRIGRRVARIARAFEMRVVAYDPYLDDPDFHSVEAERMGLDEVLRCSDVVSFHVPATRQTRRLINQNTIECLHEDAILINTSRGGVIDEDCLMQALRDRQIGAVGLDVFEREPMDQNHSLLQYPQVHVTPHIGARTEEALLASSMEAAHELVRVLRGEDFKASLPPKADWYTNPSTLEY